MNREGEAGGGREQGKRKPRDFKGSQDPSLAPWVLLALSTSETAGPLSLIEKCSQARTGVISQKACKAATLAQVQPQPRRTPGAGDYLQFPAKSKSALTRIKAGGPEDNNLVSPSWQRPLRRH